MKKVSAAIIAVLALGVAGCGFSDEEAGGARTLNWYVFNEPGGANEAAIAACNKQANGRYRIQYQRLPTDANQQRELIVRRLAAEDDSVDLVGMDVIWTAEFGEAGWILPWDGARREQAIGGKVEGPRKTVEYEGKVWGIPFTTNTQLLWYRKDKVDKPPEDFTWDEMIEAAAKDNKSIEVQAAQYEGYAVWVNALIAERGRAGGRPGRQREGRQERDAGRRDHPQARRPRAARPGMATNKEDQARIGFESERSNYQVNYSFIYPSAAEQKGEKFQKNIGWARYPRVEADEPSKPPLGGINIGVGAYTKNRDLAFEAARCLAQPDNQVVASEKGGLPPTTESAYDDPKVKKALPFADLLKESIEDGGPRPVNPAYSDISLAHPEDLPPADRHQPGRDRGQAAETGWSSAAEGKVF